eukprot:9731726-Ditylum_brightwellii.AAC.1
MTTAQSNKARKVRDTTKAVATNNNKDVHFFTGVYEGKLGKIDTTRHVLAGRVAVLVDIGSGVTKKAIVSVWSSARPHPEKACSFAEAV